MFHSKVHIEAGDLVILYMTRTAMNAITVTPGEVFHNKFGRYRHEDLVGQKYGSKLHSPPPQSGYIYLLRPTPELWTLSLPHRTQILYMPDIAYIIMRLGVRIGGKVLEAGTGSGSMTHSLSRAVGRNGYVGSYEYHQSRCEKAKIEFEEHSLNNVRLQHRNVCKDGFGEVDKVEAVFLDLPAPWEAIPHAINTLRPDIITRICCFSPCLEQVLKTVSTLREYGFSDISTQEVLVRTYELLPPSPPESKHLRSVDDIVSSLKTHEKKKEERRVIQMRTAREKAKRVREEKAAVADPDGLEVEMELGDMLRGEDDVEVVGEGDMPEGSKKRKVDQRSQEGVEEISLSPKKARTGEMVSISNGVETTSSTTTEADPDLAISSAAPLTDTVAPPTINTTILPPPVENSATTAKSASASASTLAAPAPAPAHTSSSSAGPSRTPHRKNRFFQPEIKLDSQLLLRIAPEMRGHTSYLTFASFYPESIRKAVVERGGMNTPALRRQGGQGSGSGSVTPGVGLVDEAVPVQDENGASGGEIATAKEGSGPAAPQAGSGAEGATGGQATAVASADKAPSEVASTEIGTEYGDQSMDQVMGTLTEEEMIAMLS